MNMAMLDSNKDGDKAMTAAVKVTTMDHGGGI